MHNISLFPEFAKRFHVLCLGACNSKLLQFMEKVFSGVCQLFCLFNHLWLLQIQWEVSPRHHTGSLLHFSSYWNQFNVQTATVGYREVLVAWTTNGRKELRSKVVDTVNINSTNKWMLTERVQSSSEIQCILNTIHSSSEIQCEPGVVNVHPLQRI